MLPTGDARSHRTLGVLAIGFCSAVLACQVTPDEPIEEDPEPCESTCPPDHGCVNGVCMQRCESSEDCLPPDTTCVGGFCLMPICGNHLLEADELCDGDCPSDCPSDDPCVVGVLSGSAATCDASCSHEAIVVCEDDDGCCLEQCDSHSDNDCGTETISFPQDFKIFPGAVGYGTESRGAYELFRQTGDPDDLPTILYVDTLVADNVQTSTNSGSFEWALRQDFPRIILFSVSGVIDYRDTGYAHMVVDADYLSVYGQTAPNEGINIIAFYLLIRADHVLLQHLRFRAGDEFHPDVQPADIDGITIEAADHVVVDHCSFSWSQDETINVTPHASNVTISNSFIYNPLHYSLHVNEHEAPHEPERHGFAALLEGQHQTFFDNVIYRSQYRNPSVGSLSNNSILINNIANNPGYTTGVLHAGSNMIYIGNVVNQISGFEWENDTAGDLSSSSEQFYAADNWCRYREDHPTAPEIDLFRNPNGETNELTPFLDLSEYTIRTTDELIAQLYDEVGALPRRRDLHDTVNIEDCRNLIGGYVNSPNPLPAKAYNRSVYESDYTPDTAGDMRNGHDWSTNPQQLTIDGHTITLDARCANVSEVVAHINSKLPVGYEAVKHVATEYVILQTTQTGSGASMTISGSACETLGINEGTYVGEDGDHGYPQYPEIGVSLDIPSDPHDPGDRSNYTRLEEWLYTLTQL